MKKILVVLLMIVMPAMFTSCATGPSYSEISRSAPALAIDAGRIYFYRDVVLNPRQQPAIKVNGQDVGATKPLGFLYIDRPAGDYKIEIANEAGSLPLTLGQGQTRYVRISLTSEFPISHFHLVSVDDAIGQREIVSCKYTGSQQ